MKQNMVFSWTRLIQADSRAWTGMQVTGQQHIVNMHANARRFFAIRTTAILSVQYPWRQLVDVHWISTPALRRLSYPSYLNDCTPEPKYTCCRNYCNYAHLLYVIVNWCLQIAWVFLLFLYAATPVLLTYWPLWTKKFQQSSGDLLSVRMNLYWKTWSSLFRSEITVNNTFITSPPSK